jgi:acetyltransferase-like isoleucine patch superfamily enzyme
VAARVVDRAARAGLRERIRPEEFAAFGEGSVIEPPLRVRNRALVALGRGVHVGSGAWLAVTGTQALPGETPLTIGDRAELGPDLVISCERRVRIGADVLAASRVFIGDSYHDYRDPTRPIRAQGMAEARLVTIGDGAFLGIGATILPGVTIGENAYVGAGSIVTADVPPRCVAVGNPARIVRHWDARAAAWLPGSPGPGDEG